MDKAASKLLMSRRHLVTASIGAVCLCSFSRATAPAADLPGVAATVRATRFRIMWKGSEVGYHRIAITPDGNAMTIVTSIRMKIKLAFVTAFRYEHDCTETWFAGRLQNLESKTDNNGDKLKAKGKATEDGFEIVGPSGPFTTAADTLTTNSLWSPAFVAQSELIDAQNGGTIGLVSKPLGKNDVTIAAARLPTVSYDLVTPYLSGQVWYDANDRWVKGVFEREGERVSYDLEA